MTREEIQKVLTDRMGEYFRPAAGSWRLHPADLTGVVVELMASELVRLATENNEDFWAAPLDDYVEAVDFGTIMARARELRGDGEQS